ncbi:hypothetical protein PV762_09360 [Mitsuaria sp. CC2]|uniref:hypothetical protein n=1 Tax=Mitsuaria sp. CC2 TaxID=3029186 RepID=UPI003B8AC923
MTATEHAELSQMLRAAVEETYVAFAEFRRPALPLDVCTACCMPEEVDKQLREWPLKRLTVEHLFEYGDSAKSQVQNPAEVGYFVPRMLELLAQGAEIRHSLAIALDRLGGCPPGSWTASQQSALSGFALAYFALAIRAGIDPSRPALLHDPFEVLLMFDVGGIAIQPLLAHWLECDDPMSTAQFVRESHWRFWGEHDYSNPFAWDRGEFRQVIRAWMLDANTRRRFTEKLLSSDFLAIVPTVRGNAHVSFATMVDGVFEHLVR